MLVGIWFGLYWVLSSFLDQYIQSSVQHGLLGQHTIPTTATQGSIAETQVLRPPPALPLLHCASRQLHAWAKVRNFLGVALIDSAL